MIKNWQKNNRNRNEIIKMTEEKKLGYTLACGWANGLHKNQLFFVFELTRRSWSIAIHFSVVRFCFLLLHSFKHIYSLTQLFTNKSTTKDVDSMRFDSIKMKHFEKIMQII